MSLVGTTLEVFGAYSVLLAIKSVLLLYERVLAPRSFSEASTTYGSSAIKGQKKSVS